MSSTSSFYLRTWSVGKHRASWNADMSIKVQVVLYLNHSNSRFQYVSSNLNRPLFYVRNPQLALPILSSFAGGEDQACLEFHSPSEAWDRGPLQWCGLLGDLDPCAFWGAVKLKLMINLLKDVITLISILFNTFSAVSNWFFCVWELNLKSRELAKTWFWGIECRPLQEHLGTCEAGAWGLRPGQVFDHSLGTATKGSFEKMGTKFPDSRDSWLSQDAPSGDFHWLLPVVARLEEESGGWVSWFLWRNGDMPSENWMWRGVTLRFCFKEKT